jgi:hypothetical protein
VKSTNYTADRAGWQIDGDGNAEFNSIYARGSIKTILFEHQQIAAVGGRIMLSVNSAETNGTAFVENAPTSTSLDMWNYNKQSTGTAVASVDDILRIKVFDPITGVDDTWLKVTAVSSDKGGFRTYTCLYQSGDHSFTIYDGQAVVNYGQSGDGIIDLQAGDTTRIDIATHAGSPWSAMTDRVVIGDMYGAYQDTPAHRYGIGVGDYSGGNYMSYNAETADTFIIKGGDGAVTISDAGIQIWDAADNTSRINWYYDDTGTSRLIGDVYGDYDGGIGSSGVMWLVSYRASGDPWSDNIVAILARDTVPGTPTESSMYFWGDGLVDLNADGVIDIDAESNILITSQTYIYEDADALFLTGTVGSDSAYVHINWGDAVAISATNGTNTSTLYVKNSGEITASCNQFNFEGDLVIKDGEDIYSDGDDWQNWYSSSTVVGWSSYTQQNIWYKKVGKLVFVKYYLSGTSNATGVTFTLPFACHTNIAAINYSRVQDNGTWASGHTAMASGSSQVVVRVGHGTSASTWTASGPKSCIGEFFYETD